MSESSKTGATRTKRHLCNYVANGSLKTLRTVLERTKCDPNELGPDGTSPLCVAALWGNDKMVECLVSNGAKVNVRNRGTEWTPLHAATFQEHGKVVHKLLRLGANMEAKDHRGRTPKDYASISETIWPFFESKGYRRTSKHELVRKGIIRKIEETKTQLSSKIQDSLSAAEESVRAKSTMVQRLKYFSRPGSSYAKCDYNPLRPLSARRLRDAGKSLLNGPL